MKKSLFAISLCVLSSCSTESSHKEQQSLSTPQAADATPLKLHVPSPEWQDQVVYFLMTDRFADGDPTNNDQGAGEYDPTRESHYSGGDIQGIIDHLDYIQNLGATAVWATPLVANQWWSKAGNYGGYHGYWATDFSAIDAHVGDIDTYKQLSHNLHTRGMYLIQDIVVNHTGNFFNYQGGLQGYNPLDTAENFVLLEDSEGNQPAPVQPPFDMIDRNNPEHVAANIYNWTPSITDYRDQTQQFRYQLATLADINTQNPLVVETFKRIYGDWIKKVGVDAFRIDTVRYVEHDFFHHFMHDPNGIHAVAAETGRQDFLAFGEVFDTSLAYQNDAEQRVASYLGTENKPELNSVISFPLHHELKTVFAQGAPTDHLAYRISQHMTVYDNPHIIPTFIDNHDMARFLASGDIDGFKQAIATILTIPGIPVIYQGSAQQMTESRQAMFEGGFMAEADAFNQESEMYRFISQLATLRTSDKLFTRGTLTLLAANKNGPGLLAYVREYQGRKVLVLLNTSNQDILVDKLKISQHGATLQPLFGTNDNLNVDGDGLFTTVLGGRSILIAEVIASEHGTSTIKPTLTIVTPEPAHAVNADLTITGHSTLPNNQLVVLKNTRLDSAKVIMTDDNGDWQYTYPVANLGQEQVSLMAYHPKTRTTSQAYRFTTDVDVPEYELILTDPIDDDTGLSGRITSPTHKLSLGQQDISQVEARIGGDILTLTFTMKTVTDSWIPANGFDNVAFSIFFDLPEQQGSTVLPLLNGAMPNNWRWSLGHVAYGWGNTTFSNQGATAHHQGKKLGVAPKVAVDKEKRQIAFTYNASDLGLSQWQNSRVFITTWDITGEGMYRDLQPSSSNWSFGGGHHDDAKIADFIELVLH